MQIMSEIAYRDKEGLAAADFIINLPVGEDGISLHPSLLNKSVSVFGEVLWEGWGTFHERSRCRYRTLSLAGLTWDDLEDQIFLKSERSIRALRGLLESSRQPLADKPANRTIVFTL